ncbi:MAG: 50S ribosomal protein L22 [Candidatus Gracilibacteria bacterium]
MKAFLKNVRISPEKANLVAGLVRGAMVVPALNQLKFTPKKGAKILYKVIESAMSNAEQNLKQNREKLYVKEIVITKGPMFKRGMSVSRGRVHPILKRTSQIRVTLDLKAGVTEKPKAKKSAIKTSKLK